CFFFFSSRRRHTSFSRDWSSDVCSSDLNAGRGSLLDSRWELARDSKLGIFQLRAYKPVYLLPGFWTSDVNATPSSPNPANTVTRSEERRVGQECRPRRSP